MPSIAYRDEFARDLSKELAYLVGHRELSWVTVLQEHLADLEGLLATFPEAGAAPREDTPVLRKLRLRRAPFYVWYAIDPRRRDAPVTFLRLFHVRQDSPAPRAP
ncbi:MAG: hypothetical protein EXR61_00895 [Chloroflexi bacterium]|nr:hypothetical protein [Chloroflexota bacterium]